MTYITTTNYNKIASEQPKKKGRPRKIKPKQETKSNEFKIEKVYSESPSLTEMEKETISEILDCSLGVFYKPRQRCSTMITAPQKWQMIWDDEISYLGWVEANNLYNAQRDGYEVDILNYTSEGVQ